MASPALRGQTAPAAGGTVTSPASTEVGDLVIVYTFERLGAGTASTLTVNEGASFTPILNHFHNDGSTDGALAVAYKVATQGGAQSYQGFTSSTGTPVWWTGCSVLQVGTFDVASILSAGVSQTNNAVPNPPSVANMVAAREYLVFAIAGWHLGSSVDNAATVPSGYGNLVQVAGAATGDLACASLAMTGVTTTDPPAYGDNQTPNGTCSITVAIASPVPPKEGFGVPALTLGATGVGASLRSGFAAAAVVLLSAGVGEAPVAAVPEGSGTSALTLGVSATGQAVHRGQGTGALSLGTVGAGTSARSGDGAPVLSLSTVGVGAQSAYGGGVSTLSLVVAGVGDAPEDAEAAEGFGTIALTLSAAGAGQRRCSGEGTAELALSASALPAVVDAPPPPLPQAHHQCSTSNTLRGVMGGPSLGRRRR
jgi:hypothetical protein